MELKTMDSDIVLGKILSLWRDSGATLRENPTKIQYLPKEPRPNSVTLVLEYGVPKRLRTPNETYEISTTMYGNTSKFAVGLGIMFDYSIQYPEELRGVKEISLRNMVNSYTSLVITINGFK